MPKTYGEFAYTAAQHLNTTELIVHNWKALLYLGAGPLLELLRYLYSHVCSGEEFQIYLLPAVSPQAGCSSYYSIREMRLR